MSVIFLFFHGCVASSVGAWKAIKQSEFLFDKYVLGMIAVGAVINAVMWYYLAHALHQPQNAFVTLHFTTALGADLIGEASEIYNAPLYIALISAANIMLARLIYSYDVLLAYFLVTAVPLLNIFALVNGALLVAMNA
ncbi:MAG: hypothetical protein NUV61_00790 [Candidatus Azambacteria bacterium]|nr:hypothetical protein [Candidatus Azambacteria bacterium]